ncbi:hypothetical protein [Archaeoglobus sp.]
MKPETGRLSTTNVSKVTKVAESQNGESAHRYLYSFKRGSGLFFNP